MRAALLLAAPAYLWLLATVLLPLAVMLYFSLLTVAPINGRAADLTLANYAQFFARDFYRTLTWRSLTLGAETTGACFLVGFPTAWVLARLAPGRTREALLVLVVLPFWSNALVRVFSWTMVLRGNGLFSAVLPGDLLFTWTAIVIGLVHSYLPYMILTCYLSLAAIDPQLLEAARSLGATRAQAMVRVVLPLATPGILAGSVLIFVPVVGSFMEPRILGGRSGAVLGTVIEDQFTAVFNWPLGAALSYTLLAIMLLIGAALSPLLRGRLQPA